MVGWRSLSPRGVCKRFRGLGPVGPCAMVLLIVLAWGVGEIMNLAGDDDVRRMWSLVLIVLALTFNCLASGLETLIKSSLPRDLSMRACLWFRAAILSLVEFLLAVGCVEDLPIIFEGDFLELPFLGLLDGIFHVACLMGELEYAAGVVEGAGLSTGVDCYAVVNCVLMVLWAGASALRLLVFLLNRLIVFFFSFGCINLLSCMLQILGDGV